MHAAPSLVRACLPYVSAFRFEGIEADHSTVLDGCDLDFQQRFSPRSPKRSPPEVYVSRRTSPSASECASLKYWTRVVVLTPGGILLPQSHGGQVDREKAPSISVPPLIPLLLPWQLPCPDYEIVVAKPTLRRTGRRPWFSLPAGVASRHEEERSRPVGSERSSVARRAVVEGCAAASTDLWRTRWHCPRVLASQCPSAGPPHDTKVASTEKRPSEPQAKVIDLLLARIADKCDLSRRQADALLILPRDVNFIRAVFLRWACDPPVRFRDRVHARAGHPGYPDVPSPGISAD